MARRKKIKRRANVKDTAVKEYYQKVLIMQEDEKKRISRDLHDETGQVVIALGAMLNVMEKELKSGNTVKALEIISESRKIIDEIGTRMKAMALRLRPPGFDILGLPAVLRDYFAQCTKSSPVKIEFNENLKDKKLDENVEIALYRIMQEAMYNIQKHSMATLVKVNLIINEGELKLIIEDNGKGFDVEEHEKSPDTAKLGLHGIKERVNMLNGAFSVESAPEAGTKLKIVLSLKKAQDGYRSNAG